MIADVTTNYLNLLELDREIEIAHHTREIGEQGLNLPKCGISAAPRPALMSDRRKSCYTPLLHRSRQLSASVEKPRML